MNYRLICAFLLLSLFACQPDESTETPILERPHSPWVFRSVIDSMPRMITLGLHDNLWASYHTMTGSLYKTWKGSVNFDGAVYTTVHGPQPSSIGHNWMVNAYDQPWILLKNGQEMPLEVQYKGHSFAGGHAQLHYLLKASDGTEIKVTEQPEYVENEKALPGFERTFTTQNVPENAQVGLQANIGSIALQANIITDGQWKTKQTAPQKRKGLSGIEVTGTLLLNSNATTQLTTYHTSSPLIENQNKVVGAEEEEEAALPAGYKLIARNDCKSCHNTYVNTVGPSYKEVAKKYRNTPENIAMLSKKVKNGGGGVWGAAVMTAHPELAMSDIEAMIAYIMELDAEDEAARRAKEAASGNENINYASGTSVGKEDDIFPGAIVKAYVSKTPLSEMDDVNQDRKPDYEGIISKINLMGTDLAAMPDHTAYVFSGYLKMPANGNFVFRIKSDDGSRLWIDDKMIIDNDGLHGATAKDGEVALSEGYHPFKLEFFQGTGGKMVSFKWQPYGGDGFEPVPPSVMVHHKSDKPAELVTIGSKEKLPGDGAALESVHPSYTLTQARPNTFLPKVGGMDFLSDGSMVVSTWDAAGAVYRVTNVDTGDPSKMTATKIAEGLAEPLGLKVVDDEIYVLQKQELTKLVDIDEDGIMDQYQTVNNSWSTTGNFHEFAFGLVYKDGWFYGNLAIAILPGGASASPQAPDRGKTFRINKDTGEIQFVASGLRTPNGIGLGIDNEIFVADNQGDWLPASKIVHVTDGAFFNSYAVNPEYLTQKKPIKQPVVWLPQDEIGNSPTTPLSIMDGPYKGQMIHSEVTHGGVKRDFVEKVNGEYQGAVFRFIQGLEAGVNRMAWGPDGALYIGGVGSTGNWQQYGKLWYGLQRLKYNEKSAFEMLAIRAHTNGFEIEMTEPLAEGDGWKADEYDIQQWRYEPTEEYGGPKLDQESLTVKSANVSEDRKKIFLELEGMKPGHVVYFHLPNHWVSAKGTESWSTEAWYTLNNIPENKMGFSTTAPAPVPVNTLSDSEKAAGWQLLFDGKTTAGWRNFNKSTIGSSWKVEDGALVLEVEKQPDGSTKAADGGDIITDRTFENFELQLEWKIAPCGNSGIMYNVVEDTAYCCPWMTGPEMQILDNSCHPDAKIETHRAGDLYDMIAAKMEVVRPAGQWNLVRIVNNNGRVDHWLNGKKIVSFEMHTDEWKKRIANSKFKEYADFGLAKSGRIALQDHSDRVAFRNVKVREL